MSDSPDFPGPQAAEILLEIRVRPATVADRAELSALMERSIRELQVPDYSAEQIEAALGDVFGLDDQLIDDGTYFAACAKGVIVGCGGWSYRRTLFGANHRSNRDDELLNPSSEPARIRAFFVHPDWARRGIGTLLLRACEGAAQAAGFFHLELGATLTGVPLYRARGYREVQRIEIALKNGLTLPIVRMEKKQGHPPAELARQMG